MTQELRLPIWINSGYHRYHADRLKYEEWEEEARREEEQEERLVTPQDYPGVDPRTPGYINLLSEEAGRSVNKWQLRQSVEAETQMMREEDWVDRYHRGEGRPVGPAIIAAVVVFAWALLIMALAWFGAAWIGQLT